MQRRVATIGLAVTLAAGSLRLQGQAALPLAHVRDLYSNAAYEDVLSAVAADSTASPQIAQYKVFSLIALGHPADAEQAAEALLAAHLTFHPDRDVAPRLIEVFANIRRKIAPDRLKSMYANARGLLDRKDRDGAIAAFTEIVTLAADPDIKDDKMVEELGLLANGFLELSRALPAAAGTSARPDAPAATPPVPASRPAPDRSTPRAAVVPPQPIREDLPRWVPPTTLARAEYRGRILVHVGVEGKVESAEILDSVHPLYDKLLLTASKSWLYSPGLSNGTPVRSDHILEVVLKPRLDLPR